MIINVEKIYNLLNKIFPIKNAENWDKVGHVLGDINQRVDNVIVALDLTPDVFEDAIQKKASVIITHHPFIFKDDIEEDFNQAPYKKKIFQKLKKTNISVISIHTNYDSNKIGTSFQVSKQLGIKKSKLCKSKYGAFYNYSITINELNKLFKEKMNLIIKDTNINNKNYKFNKWAILPGSGDPQDIIKLKKQGAKFVVTSDIKWSTWQMAKIENINLVGVSHAIEDVFTKHISELLSKKIKNINIIPKQIINFNN